VVNKIYVDMPAKAQAKYRELKRDMYTEIESKGVEAFNAAGLTMKCLQCANGAVYTDQSGAWVELHDAKLQALDSVIAEAAGMPVLVAYQFKSDLSRILRAFPQARELDSDPQTIRDWNAGKIPILVSHPQSAGHGLNLQHGSNILVFFGLWWDLEPHEQIIERIGPTRQKQSGYDRPVFVHYILARGTVDQTVFDRLQTKSTMQQTLQQMLKEKQ
jgi:SNF2 family DNA or RNA helicase